MLAVKDPFPLLLVSLQCLQGGKIACEQFSYLRLTWDVIALSPYEPVLEEHGPQVFCGMEPEEHTRQVMVVSAFGDSKMLEGLRGFKSVTKGDRRKAKEWRLLLRARLCHGLPPELEQLLVQRLCESVFTLSPAPEWLSTSSQSKKHEGCLVLVFRHKTTLGPLAGRKSTREMPPKHEA